MNWKSLIADLRAKGMSQPQIAAACNCGQATISDLASGKTDDPRYSLGQALQALHVALISTDAAPELAATQPTTETASAGV